MDVVNKDRCRAMGIDVVRRIGGGAAVHHGDEITYCFVSRNDLLPIPTGVQWHTVFSLFLKKLGLTPDALVETRKENIPLGQSGNKRDLLKENSPHPSFAKGGGGQPGDSNACFACAAEDEPTVGGKKFVGSARRKSKHVFLQHGSILLAPQPAFLRDLVPGAEPDASLGLNSLLPSLTCETAHTALIAAIEETFSLGFPRS